jgi:DNA (cytosine-5)-methyltransferase 1
VVAPFLSKVNHGDKEGERRPESVEDPLSTVCAQRRQHGIVVPAIVPQQHMNAPKGVDEPLQTITTQGNKNTLCMAWLAKHFGGMTGHDVFRPVGAVTSRDHHAVAAAYISQMKGDPDSHIGARSMEDSVPSICAGGNHVAEVRAFLTTYYGSGSEGQLLTEPMRTITSKHRLGLVTLEGVDYQIVDIGMRMLEPHELLLAQFGEYAEHFSFDIGVPVTKANQVRLIGNSVPPAVVRAIVEANKLRLPAVAEAA